MEKTPRSNKEGILLESTQEIEDRIKSGEIPIIANKDENNLHTDKNIKRIAKLFTKKYEPFDFEKLSDGRL